MNLYLVLLLWRFIGLEDEGEVVHPASAVDQDRVRLVRSGIPVVQGKRITI